MLSGFLKNFIESLDLTKSCQKNGLFDEMERAAKAMIETLEKGGKILVAGNGGSASQAQHFATELAVRYKLNRRALAAVALTADSSLITAAGNDLGFEEIFSRQIEALGKKGDVFLGISTSGKSPNILRAFEKAEIMGLKTIALLGGEKPKNISLTSGLNVPSGDTARIQEMHLLIIHSICEAIECHFKA